MKAILRHVSLGLALTLWIQAPLLRAGQEGKQPKMEDAVHDLQDAKRASDPIPLLQKAKGEVKKASKNKHGDRKKAMSIIDLAIAAAQDGNTKDMTSKIDSAIATIHDGMSKAD
jgi:hypothetical protein